MSPNSLKPLVSLKSLVLFFLTFAVLNSALLNVSLSQDGSLRRVRNSVRKDGEDEQSSSKRKHNDSSNQSSESESEPSRGDLQQVRNAVSGNRNNRRSRSEQNGHHQPGSTGHRDRLHQNNASFFFSCSDWNHQRIHCPPISPYRETVVVYQEPVYYSPDAYAGDPGYSSSVYTSPVEQAGVIESCESRYLFDEFSGWSARGSISVGADFDDLSQVNLSTLFQTPGGVGLDLSVSTLREQGLSPSLFAFRDNLWIGDVNVVFEPVCSNDIRLRFGIGLNWLADSYGAEAGLNLTTGVDLKLTEKLTLSAEGDIGTLGEADFWHGRINLARKIGAADWLVGVDHYNIGGVNLHNVFTGIGFRF